MHAKAVIYDGISVSSGSMNRTEAAFHENQKVCNIFVNIPEYARQHLKLFKQAAEKKAHRQNRILKMSFAAQVNLIPYEQALSFYLPRRILRQKKPPEIIRRFVSEEHP